MSIRKTFLAASMLLLIINTIAAQNTNSTYSGYGIGYLETPALGKSRAMGGIGYGLREKGIINPMNPASYSAVDTLNFLFDFGVSAQMTRFKEGSVVEYNPNGNLDYAAMKFALKPNWGVAMGLVPYSNVGYSFNVEKEDDTPFTTTDGTTNTLEYVKTYSGSGGLNTLFLGTSVDVLKGLSIGANFKYIFGTLENISSTTYTTSGYNDLYIYNYKFIKTVGLDLGLQYARTIGKKGNLTLGAVVSKAVPFYAQIYKVSIASDTAASTTHADFELPNTLGVGFAYTYDRRLTIGFDYENQAWSKCLYMGVSDSLKDNNRYSLGVEYLPSLIASSYFQAIRYRCGFQYTDTYLKVPGDLKNAALTFGFGLPLRNQKSVLNLGFEIGKVITPDASYISENYYKMSVDISFNELWFFKRKL
jgi:hypothetical protein